VPVPYEIPVLPAADAREMRWLDRDRREMQVLLPPGRESERQAGPGESGVMNIIAELHVNWAGERPEFTAPPGWEITCADLHVDRRLVNTTLVTVRGGLMLPDWREFCDYLRSVPEECCLQGDEKW